MKQQGETIIRRLSGVLTPERVRAYPLISLIVLLCVAVYDRLSGEGLMNGIAGAFGGDFLSFYTGGSFALRGTTEALANADAQMEFQRQVLGVAVDEVSLWVSPPYFAWAFAPLAALPYTFAFLSFLIISGVSLGYGFRALASELSLGTSPRQMLWMGLQYYPTLNWLLNGQMSALWLTVLTGVFVLLRRRRETLAGLLLGCFACKPPLALGLFVALLAARRWRVLGAACVSAGGLVMVGWLFAPEAMRDYSMRSGELVAIVRSGGYNTAGLHGSFELSALLLDGISRPLATGVGCVLTLALLGAIAGSWLGEPWLPGTRAWDLRMAATLALGVIASPHLFVYDLMLLLLPLFIAAAWFPSKGGLPLGAGLVLLLTSIVWALGLLSPVAALAQQHLSRALFGFPAALQLGAFAIAGWAFVVAREAKGSPLPAEPGHVASSAMRPN